MSKDDIMTNYSTSGSGVNGTLRHFDREKLIWDAPFNVNQKITLLALNSFVDGDGKCWPGQPRLAGMTGLTDRTIRNVCSSLEAYEFDGKTLQILERIARYKDGHRTSSIYKVNFHLIPQPEPDSGMKKQPEPDSGMKGVIPEPDSGKQPERGSDDLSSLDLPSKNDLSSLSTPQGGTGQGRSDDKPGRDSEKPKKKDGYTPDLWVAAHNDYKPSAWPVVKTMDGKSRSAGVKAMIQAFGSESEALQAYALVLTWIRTGSGDNPTWWRAKDITFENFVKTTAAHVVSFYEKALNAGFTEAVPTASSPTPHMHPTGEDPARLEAEMRAEHGRLYHTGVLIMSGSGCSRFGVTTIYDIAKRPTEAIAYLTWLKQQPTPQDELWAL